VAITVGTAGAFEHRVVDACKSSVLVMSNHLILAIGLLLVSLMRLEPRVNQRERGRGSGRISSSCLSPRFEVFVETSS
jgi:hypothetical protein